MVVSLGSGPWDQLFGGGNTPAFAVATFSAFVSGMVALLALPRSRVERSRVEKPRLRLLGIVLNYSPILLCELLPCIKCMHLDYRLLF